MREISHTNAIFKKLRKIKFKKTKISDKKIKLIKSTTGWVGKGTKANPIIIDNLIKLHPNLKFHSNTLHYYLKDLYLHKLTCQFAQNITIENCTIYKFKMDNCHNFTLLNNKILNYKIIYSKANTIIDNQISNIYKLKIDESKDINPLSNPITYCLIFICVPAFISGSVFWFLGFIPLYFLARMSYINYKRVKRMQNKKNNKFINNTKLRNRKKVIAEILNHYNILYRI